MAAAEATKVCCRCKVAKKLSEFSPGKKYSDGRVGHCRACAAAYNARPEVASRRHAKQKEYRESVRGRIVIRAGSRRYEASESGKASRRKKRQSQSHKSGNRRYDVKNRGKRAAHSAVKYAVDNGRIPRAKSLKCASCGKQASHYHHHNGYDREHWLDVVPLCNLCHGSEHAKYSVPEFGCTDGKQLVELLDELGIHKDSKSVHLSSQDSVDQSHGASHDNGNFVEEL